MSITDFRNSYTVSFQSVTILHNRLIKIILDSSYITQYIYLLILLTEINCKNQLNVNTTLSHISSSSHLIESINPMNFINRRSLRNTIQTNNDGLSIMQNNDVSSTTIQIGFIITEEAPIGTIVGNLLDKLQLHNPNLLLTKNSLTTSKNNQQFVNLKPIPYISLNQTTGDLIVRARIDRESLCDAIGTCCHTDRLTDYHLWLDNKLEISNNDKSAEHLSLMSSSCVLRMLVLFHIDNEQFLEIIIYVLDINDNSPKWMQSVIELEIPEHVAIGTSYQLPEAVDFDQGPMHTVVSYELENKPLKDNQYQSSKHSAPNQSRRDVLDKQPFSLDVHILESANSELQTFSLRLRVEEDLDRETHPVYELMLYAIDGGETNQMNTRKQYASSDSYRFPNASNRYTGSVLIRVLLMDKNDNAPLFKNSNPTIVIPENIKPGTVIYQAVATDLDSNDQDSLVYKIGPSANAEVQRCFRLNSKTGELIVITSLSYQNASLLQLDNSNTEINQNSRLNTASSSSQMGYIVPIQVSDQIHITEMTLKIGLKKINMNPPTIHVASHLRLSSRGNQIWIGEDTQPGSLVAMINVVDLDEIVPQTRLNQVISSPQKSDCRSKHEYFEIIPLHTATNSDFKVLLKKSLDRETKSSHTLKIECWDSGEPPLTAETSIIIQVDDINDSPPVFERQFYFAKIKEGLDPSTPIIQVQATDADLGKNAEIIYRLISQEYTSATPLSEPICSSLNPLNFENNLIMINENTGELISQTSLDRESVSSINCTDVNDCKPVFNESSYEFTLIEGQKSHYQIGRVFAIDCDAELSNRMIRYSMRPSPGAGGHLVKLYVYVSFEGIIYTHQTTDREQTPVLTFEVIATDTGNPPLSAVSSVLIRILDTNDNAPVWIFPKQFGANSVINISQYSTVGLLITQLRAIDADEGLNGEVIYSIVHGNDDGLFEVDPMSGALYLVRSFYHLSQTMNLKTLTKEEVNNSGLYQFGELAETFGKIHEQVHSYRLLLKAQDRGTPSRQNTTVLYVAVLPSQLDKQSQTDRISMESVYQHPDLKRQVGSNFSDVRRMDRDLIVMVVLIALTLIISVILIMAIFLIRCKGLLCVNLFSRSNRRRNNNNDNVNNNQLTLENHAIQSVNGNECSFIGDQWWNKSWKGKTLPTDYCINKGGDLLSTSCQDMYRASTLEHCPEFNLLRCVQNTASTSPCDHILLKDSTYRTLDPDTFKHSSSPQPCNSSSTFSSNTSTNPNVINNNQSQKYNTISTLHNPLTGGYVIEMNTSNTENPYTLLKTCDIPGFNKELIYQPLCSTSVSQRQYCLAPVTYEAEEEEEENQADLCVVNTCSTSPVKTNTSQRQVRLTNLNSPQINERKRKTKITIQ
ncbi:unnamed protein product [Heterobilharzia americana]|nr:unnamed protein product [Heterobilharzia americana]